MALINRIEDVSWHRNGVGGVGFHAVLFRTDIEPSDERFNLLGMSFEGKPDAQFIGIVFDEPGCCAVICTDRIATHGIAFAKGNSWRGDQYEPELREAIASASTGRVGPFSIPSA